MILQTTLCLASAAVLINLWLGIRTGRLRMALKVNVGDGGHEALVRRMRAQANFIENVPITLVLFAAVEMADRHFAWLAPLGAVFLLGRVAHGFGMDGKFRAGRPIGMLTSYLAQIVLIVSAVLIALGKL
jgi:uncharacterized membrane protein YecN with MAPEG domain